MALVPTSLVMTDLSTKWGRVTVFGDNDSIQRRYAITAEQAERAHKTQEPPPGLTKADRYNVESRPLNELQCARAPDGALYVNYGIEATDKDIRPKVALVPEGLWAYDGVVFLDSFVVRQLGL